MKIGIIREGKEPPDFRTPLPPQICRKIKERYPDITICIQPSPFRCFTDYEYQEADIEIKEDLSDCDVLFGVKEVPIPMLIPHKTYFFFSHTIKKQPYNRKMLQAILEKNITLIDYECLKTGPKNERIIAFGKWAGIVGAHNTIVTWLNRQGRYNLHFMHHYKDLEEARYHYKNINPGNIKIVLTGNGRVSNGAAYILEEMGIKQVEAMDFLSKTYDKPVFTKLRTRDMYYKPGESVFDAAHYYHDPTPYKSKFLPYTRVADIMINGIYWDKRIPVFFRLRDMQSPDFRIKVIGDISCDIAPDASIPCTIRTSSINDPVYGFDPDTGKETAPHQPRGVDVMAVDNLPNELPRDASIDFGNQLLENVIPLLLKGNSSIIKNATITQNGNLCSTYSYLEDFVNEKI